MDDATQLQVTIGMFSLAQAASQLPVVPKMQLLGMRRLIARRSISVAKNGMLPDPRISVEVLRTFLQWRAKAARVEGRGSSA